MVDINRLRDDVVEDMGYCPYTDKQLEEIVAEETRNLEINKRLETLEKRPPVVLADGKPLDAVTKVLAKTMDSALSELRSAMVDAFNQAGGHMAARAAESMKETDKALKLVAEAVSKVSKANQPEPVIVHLEQVAKGLEALSESMLKRPITFSPVINMPKVKKTLQRWHRNEESGEVEVTETEYIYDTELK